MADPRDIAIRASTQDHLDIEDIKDGIIILKDGGAAIVLATTAINFGLLSEKEQESTIFAYAQLLNSLTFQIQIIVRSSLKDISSYLRLIEEQEAKEARRLIKEQLGKYRTFVQETVQKNRVLDKKFYMVIPMSTLELGITKSLITGLTGKKTLPFDKNYILQKAKVNLYPKRDHLLRLLNRLGIKGKQLETQELIKLFFDIYNPESHGQQVVGAEQYETTLVQSTVRLNEGNHKSPGVTTANPSTQPTTTLPPSKPEIPPAAENKTPPSANNPVSADIFTSKPVAEESVRDQIDGLVKQAVDQSK